MMAICDCCNESDVFGYVLAIMSCCDLFFNQWKKQVMKAIVAPRYIVAVYILALG